MPLTFPQQLFRPLSIGGKLRTVLIVPFVLQIFTAVGLVSFLYARNGQKTVTHFANQLMEEVEQRVSDRLDTDLDHLQTINQLNHAALSSSQRDSRNLGDLKQYFWQQSQRFEQASAIRFVNEQGAVVSLTIREDGSRQYQATDANGDLNTYDTTDDGQLAQLQTVTTDHDPRADHWYKAAKAAQTSVWSEIYTKEGTPSRLTMTLGQPYYTPQGEFDGVLATDLSIERMSHFLKTLDLGTLGQAFILEPNGLLVATSTDEDLFNPTHQSPKRRSAVNSQDARTRAAVSYLKDHYGSLENISVEKPHTFEFEGNKQFLFVSPTFSQQGLNWLTVLVVPESDFMATTYENTLTMILLCVAAALAAVLVGMNTAKWVARPIMSMNRAARAIAEGNLVQQIPPTNIKELSELSNSFNEMAYQLQASFEHMRTLNLALLKSEKQLANNNKNLEKQVQLQTNELVQSEKMAALGQLTAGIAHEINTPLGVIQASSDNIETALLATMEKLPTLLQALSPNELAAFFTLVSASRHGNKLLSSREERRLKKQFKVILSESEITPTKPIADILSKMGLQPEISPFTPILLAPNNVEILNVAYQLSIIQNNSDNIRTAIQRVSKIVFALKGYARQDFSKQMTKASVLESIETVLTLYHNQLKKGVEVLKDFGEIPDIWCYPEELAQVWTNLIHNSLQAMDYKGHLAILAYSDEANIIIEVVDSGAGIPEEIREKIFTPFFTTKPAGEGSGLGLDIVSKIVKKHQGDISIESRPGRTVFKIMLPIMTEPPETNELPASQTEEKARSRQQSVSDAIAEIESTVIAFESAE